MKRMVILAALVGAFLGWWISPSRAYSAPPVQPYGGCDEAWQAPSSDGADWCRAHGWLVRSRLVVNPHGVVKAHRLPSCTYEDGSGGPLPCSWNIRTDDGNGIGLSFWVSHNQRFHYVWRTVPTGDGWRWVKRELADALAESGAPAHRWERCIVRVNPFKVACPDGFTLGG